MLPVNWSAEAEADFLAVVGYIAGQNPDAAQRMWDVIEHAVLQVSAHPYMYRHGRILGTREAVVHPNYILVYRVGSGMIDVLRVLHARQHYP